VVLLPIFIEHLGFADFRTSTVVLDIVLVYTLLIAFLMVSTIPTFSGKLLGERISREYVLPIFMLAVGFVALLVTYPFATLTGGSLLYLALIPLSWRRFGQRMRQGQAAEETEGAREEQPRIVAIRASDPPQR
jgi:CDP-diacylglycerol--serine O-phosphatidyltransferase